MSVITHDRDRFAPIHLIRWERVIENETYADVQKYPADDCPYCAGEVAEREACARIADEYDAGPISDEIRLRGEDT